MARQIEEERDCVGFINTTSIYQQKKGHTSNSRPGSRNCKKTKWRRGRWNCIGAQEKGVKFELGKWKIILKSFVLFISLSDDYP